MNPASESELLHHSQDEEETMGKLIVTEFVTLDGVAQAPGGPNEDRDGDFTHGGWSGVLWRRGGREGPLRTGQ